MGTTQNHLDIVDIKDGILVLTGGRFRIVIEAQAINFDLLSEAEQDAAIYSYANLINSLDFPMQVVIRTRQVDITNYIDYLKSFRRLQPTSILRQQLDNYMTFIQELVTENTVLFKKFYIVIPHIKKVTEQASSGLLDPILKVLGKEKVVMSYSDDDLVKAQQTFNQRTKELFWQFKRLGVGVRQLETEELIRLFYEIYNPESGQNDALRDDVLGYTSTIVQPNIG